MWPYGAVVKNTRMLVELTGYHEVLDAILDEMPCCTLVMTVSLPLRQGHIIRPHSHKLYLFANVWPCRVMPSFHGALDLQLLSSFE